MNELEIDDDLLNKIPDIIKPEKTSNRKYNEKLILFYLCFNPCAICGIKDLAVLDFHHPYEKNNCVSRMMNSDTDDLYNEMISCIVLCANCHRKQHLSKWKADLCTKLTTKDSK